MGVANFYFDSPLSPFSCVYVTSRGLGWVPISLVRTGIDIYTLGPYAGSRPLLIVECSSVLECCLQRHGSVLLSGRRQDRVERLPDQMYSKPCLHASQRC